jgi:hypothetical protein
MKKNYSTLKKIALLFFLLFSITAFSQTIIRSQSFDSGASGYSDDLGYTVSSSTYAAVSSTTSESSPNSLRFSNANGSDNRDSDVVFDNLDISAFLNTSVTVSFKAVGVDRSEDLYLDISYDDGVSYSDIIKLVDGDNNDNIDWGSPDPDNNSVSSNPYTFFVPAGNNQIRVRIRATNLDNNEFFYVDNIIIKCDKYCRSSGNTDFVTGIRRVQFNTINNGTPVERNDYSDFTGISTNVTQGTSYDLTVNLNTSGDYVINAMAWIDWNQDGDFTDTGEEFILGDTDNNSNGTTRYSPLDIPIPTTALEGNTRMRISAKWLEDPTSCENDFDGEVEDYTINIIASRSITTGTISPTSYCAGASVSIPYTTTVTYNAGNIFTAQLSNAAGNFGSPVAIGTRSSTAAGTISGTIPVGTVAGTAYRIRVVSSNPVVTGSTNVSNLTVNPTSAPPVVGTRTQPTCTTATGSVVLNGLPLQWALTQYPGGTTTTGTGTSTTIPGLSSGTYNYSVIGTNNGTGLKGEYFNNRDLFGSPALTRTDATVAFDWVNGSPGAPITNNNFSVRWTGQIQPLYSENYTFTTRSDDGIRLWINGTQIINNWTEHSVTTDNSSLISLIAGVKYDIILEYYEAAGQAVSQLSWRSASQSQQIIPQSQLYSVIASCSSPASANVVIDAQPATPAAPTVDNTTQPDCKELKGSIVLSNLPAGSWTVNPGGYTGSTTTANIIGLNPATYKFTVTTSSGCVSVAATDVVIEPAKTNTWNGTAWSQGIVPTLNDRVVFTGDYPPAADTNVDILACSCTVTGRKNVVIKSGITMKVVNEVIIEGSGTGVGTLTFENNASLVQVNDAAANTGVIIYKRTTGDIFNTDYVYWSSPVTGDDLGAIQTGTLYYSFNAAANSWVRQWASSVMLDGIGYIVRGAGTGLGNGTPFSKTASFMGKPNNGVKNVGISANKNNLIGNPYPSAIDADAFIIKNKEVLSGSLYFWTHKSAIQLAANITNGTAGSGAYAYTSDDYATYNLTGGTGTGTKADSDTSGTTAPSGKIAAGQAFFATASSAGGTASFNNSMRISGGLLGINNAQFFKLKSNSKESSSIEKNRVWINLSNTQGAFKQTLVGYITGATNDYESAYDGKSLNANAFIDFYSVQNNSKYAIQGRALPFDDNDLVPLGFKTTIAGEFKIGIDQVDGLLASKKIFLEDKLLGKVQDLSKASYDFTTETGTYDDRFVLSYANRTLEVIDNIDEKKFGVLIYNKNKEIVIKSSEEIIDKVLIYDFLGKQVFSNKNVNETDLKVSDLILISNQALIVKVILQNGEIITKKIIL